MTTLIAGFGNDLRADDGVGLAVVRQLSARDLPADVRCVEIGIGGIALLHELSAPGVDRLVIVDAVRRGGSPGTVYVLTPVLDKADEDLHGAFADAHFTEPYRALVLARALGRLPDEIHVVGIEPKETEELSIHLTPAVGRAVAVAADRALALATGPQVAGT